MKYRIRIIAMMLLIAASLSLTAQTIVTDDIGRTVTIPSNPQRVIALTRSFIDVILEIDGNLVAKVDEYNHLQRGINLPSVGAQATPNIEAIASLAPDLIIVNTRQHSNLIDTLESTGAAVYCIDPNAYDDDPMIDRIIQLGDILNRSGQARDYVSRIDSLSQNLRMGMGELAGMTGLMIFQNNRGLNVAQPTGMFGWFFMRLGIENVVPMGLPGSNQSTWIPYSQEKILLDDPDIIIIRARTSNPGQMRATREEFMNNPVWQGLSAVRSGRVYVMSSRVDTGIMGAEDALSAVAELLRGR